MSSELTREQAVTQALVRIAVVDTSLFEGGHDMPVLWTGECASIALEALSALGCEMTRDERLELARQRQRELSR